MTSQVIRIRPIRWTPQEEHRLLEMRVNGLKISEIATTLGRSDNSVWSKFWRIMHEGGMYPLRPKVVFPPAFYTRNKIFFRVLGFLLCIAFFFYVSQ